METKCVRLRPSRIKDTKPLKESQQDERMFMMISCPNNLIEEFVVQHGRVMLKNSMAQLHLLTDSTIFGAINCSNQEVLRCLAQPNPSQPYVCQNH